MYACYDANETTFRARKLQGFIFRGLLEAVAEVDSDSLMMVGNLAQNCWAVLDTHGSFITLRQREVGADIYRRGLTTQVYRLPKGREATCQGLLSDDELEHLLGTELGFEHLDQSFGYMRED